MAQRWLVLAAVTAAFSLTVIANRSGIAAGYRKDAPLACVPTAEAARQPSKDICVTAHIYDVVELQDGTRFLDVCSADLPDAECHFFILSLREDREEVGELGKYRDHDIQIRGMIRPMHGRWGMTLSHIRQLSGGPEKFRPNPKLLHGFNGQSDTRPVHDPNLSPSGRHRTFMDRAETEQLPARSRP